MTEEYNPSESGPAIPGWYINRPGKQGIAHYFENPTKEKSICKLKIWAGKPWNTAMAGLWWLCEECKEKLKL